MKLKLGILLITCIFLNVDAQEEENVTKIRLSPGDPSSFSRPDLVVVNHYEIKMDPDFERKVFSGEVLLYVTKVKEYADAIILDTNDLHIIYIRDVFTGAFLNYTVDEPYLDLGSKLTIELPSETEHIIKIAYNTKPDAAGLQWLDPETTAGKIDPFVYTQFQTIGARSFLPCQDTPSVKSTYSAEITCAKRLKVVMSAKLVETREIGLSATYHFLQVDKLPTYLFAMAIGRLSSKRIGPRSTVYAEKQFIEAVAEELNNTELQMTIAEDLCGTYEWGNYDILLMPPSYPSGAMENPGLTFVTHKILTGDKSMTSLIAHEIAHSWTGNTVTCANAEHLWLNEAFATFYQRRILGKMKGKEREDFDAVRGLDKLNDILEDLKDNINMTKLVPDLTGIHPDRYTSNIPYEKGYVFVRYLETVVGGPKFFEPFVRAYLKHFKGRSIVSNDFRKYMKEYFFENEAMDTIDWDAWLHQTGMPPIIPDYDQSITNKVLAMQTDVLAWIESSDNASFPINHYSLFAEEKQQLLTLMIKAGPVAIEKLEQWGNEWKLFEAKNPMVLILWLQLGIKSKWIEAVLPAFEYLSTFGDFYTQKRLLKELYDWEDFRALTIQLYKQNKKRLMASVRKPVEKLLNLN